MNEASRELFRRRHRIVGLHLVLEAWKRNLDCIVLDRRDLESFFGLERFKGRRVSWLEEDFKPWFPYQRVYYFSGRANSIASLYLSRVPISEHLPEGVMSDAERIHRMEPLKVARFNPNLEKILSEFEITAQLALLASGLTAPSPR